MLVRELNKEEKEQVPAVEELVQEIGELQHPVLTCS
jgi:hypothetical protein